MASDLHLRDILKKPVLFAQRVTEYSNGSWSFISLTNLAKVDGNMSYYYMSRKFGVTTLGQTNPAKTLTRGKGGDYIAFDTKNLTVSVVSSRDFTLLFPQPNINPPTPKVTSSVLQDKNKITEVYQKSLPKLSNKGKQKLTGIKGLNKPSY